MDDNITMETSKTNNAWVLRIDETVDPQLPFTVGLIKIAASLRTDSTRLNKTSNLFGSLQVWLFGNGCSNSKETLLFFFVFFCVYIKVCQYIIHSWINQLFVHFNLQKERCIQCHSMTLMLMNAFFLTLQIQNESQVSHLESHLSIKSNVWLP